MVISSRLTKRHNENEYLEMRFDCLARADEDDIDLSETRSTNLLPVDQQVSKITKLIQLYSLVRVESNLVIDTVADWQPV